MKPLRIAAADVPMDHWPDAIRGSIGWQTLLCAGKTDSNSLVAGVATLQVGDDLAAHSHPQAELYFGLEGSGTVVIDGVPHDLSPGVLLFIPGGAVHAVPPATGPLRFLYAFATNSFADVAYQFV